MIRFINLRGKINGSATLDAGERTASFELHLRRAGNKVPESKRLSVFLVSQTEVVKAAIDDELHGIGSIGNARGIIVWDGNDVISAGVNGMSERTLKKAQEKLLITIAGQQVSASSSETVDKDGNQSSSSACTECADDFVANSEAARRIRKTAKELFSANGERIESISKSEEKGGVPISNPFPHIFGRSARFCRVNESELYGTAVFRGRKCEVTAVRIFDRTRAAPPHSRAFRAADKRGYLYWIILKPGINNT